MSYLTFKAMDSDKELIKQLKTLKGIKPDSNWAALAKAQILGYEVGQKRSFMSVLSEMILQYRIALAGLLVFLMAGGTVAVAQNALPGEPLYGLKRATEKGMALVTGKDKVALANLEMAAKRLEEINQMSEKNLVKNLPAAFEEYRTAKAEAKIKVAAAIQKNPEKANEILKDAAVAMKDIDNKEKEVYGVLGLDDNASSTDDGMDSATDKAIVATLIENLRDDANLTEDQIKDFELVNTLFQAGNYSQALDRYLNSSLNK